MRFPFTGESVRLMLLDNLNAREVAGKLGVRMSLLYRWKKDFSNELEQEA